MLHEEEIYVPLFYIHVGPKADLNDIAEFFAEFGKRLNICLDDSPKDDYRLIL